MAKPSRNTSKPAAKSAPSNGKKSAAPTKVAARSAVRNSPIPKIAVAAAPTVPMSISYERIAVRAYEIWQSGHGGSEFDNWVRAERELRGV